jgi:hypothetical protein
VAFQDSFHVLAGVGHAASICALKSRNNQ